MYSLHKAKVKIIYDSEAQAYLFRVKCPYHGLLIVTPFWDSAIYIAVRHHVAYKNVGTQ